MTININKPILKSPKKNKLSKSLMNKLTNKEPESISKKPKSENFKKIKLSSSRSNKKLKNNLFIPTDLSMINKPKELTVYKSNESPVPEVKPPDEIKSVSKEVISDKEVKSDVKQNLNVEKKSKKMSKRRLSRRKKSSKNKTVSIDLNNNKTVKKEKDIIELIDKFEKMDVKEIKTFLKNKGIQSKNNTKSKLLPYLYLLTCVDDDINIIKS